MAKALTEKFVENKLLTLQKGQRVLDIGCGRGQESLYLVSQGLRVDAFDQNAERYKEAQETTGESVNFFVDSVQKFHYPKDTYDFVLAKNVLFFLKSKLEVETALNQLYESLKCDGKLYFTLLGEEDVWVKEGRVLGHSWDEVVDLLKQHSFQVHYFHTFTDVLPMESGELKEWNFHQVFVQKRCSGDGAR